MFFKKCAKLRLLIKTVLKQSDSNERFISESTDADNEGAGSSSLSRTVSNDSLDTLPLPDSMNSSTYVKMHPASGENVFLRQIRSKLKKRSETPELDHIDSDTADGLFELELKFFSHYFVAETTKSEKSPFGSLNKSSIKYPIKNAPEFSENHSRVSPVPVPPSRNASVSVRPDSKAEDSSDETTKDVGMWGPKHAVTRKIEIVKVFLFVYLQFRILLFNLYSFKDSYLFQNDSYPNVEGELKAKIRNLRHVPKEESNTSSQEDLPLDATDNTNDSIIVIPRDEKAKVRQLVTQKVSPLQHHRPFSLQCPNNSTSSAISHSEHADSSETSSLSGVYEERMKPELPRKRSNGDTKVVPVTWIINGEKEPNGMARTKSLRDITSKFEQLGTASTIESKIEGVYAFLVSVSCSSVK